MKKILLIGLCMSGSLYGMESEGGNEPNAELLKELKKTESSDGSAVDLLEEIKQLKQLKKGVDAKIDLQELEVVEVAQLRADESELINLRRLVGDLKAKISQLEESNKDLTTKLRAAQRLCKIEEAAVSIGLGMAGVILYFVLFA